MLWACVSVCAYTYVLYGCVQVCCKYLFVCVYISKCLCVCVCSELLLLLLLWPWSCCDLAWNTLLGQADISSPQRINNLSALGQQ